MPIYEYICDACGKTKEIQRTVGERNEPVYCTHQCSLFPGDGPYPKKYLMRRLFSGRVSYQMKGDNSASVTPKKFRREE